MAGYQIPPNLAAKTSHEHSLSPAVSAGQVQERLGSGSAKASRTLLATSASPEGDAKWGRKIQSQGLPGPIPGQCMLVVSGKSLLLATWTSREGCLNDGGMTSWQLAFPPVQLIQESKAGATRFLSLSSEVTVTLPSRLPGYTVFTMGRDP